MRFSLATLLLFVTVVALALVTIRQSRQSNQIRDLSARLEPLERCSRVQGRINEFIATLDLDSDEDDRESCQQLIDIDGNAGWLEVLSLSHRPLPHPSHDYSVNVLFNHTEIIDVLVVKSTPMEHADVEFVDDNQDGRIDLVVSKQVMFAKEVSRYEITPDGFTQIVDDEIGE